MNRADRLTCEDPQELLDSLEASGKHTEGGARLLAAALCRRVWHALADDRSRRAVEIAERFADTGEGAEELSAAQALARQAVNRAMAESRPRPDGVIYGEDHPDIYAADAAW